MIFGHHTHCFETVVGSFVVQTSVAGPVAFQNSTCSRGFTPNEACQSRIIPRSGHSGLSMPLSVLSIVDLFVFPDKSAVDRMTIATLPSKWFD